MKALLINPPELLKAHVLMHLLLDVESADQHHLDKLNKNKKEI